MVKERMMIEMKGQYKMRDLIKEGEGWGTGRKIARNLNKCDELKNYVTPGSGVLLEHPIII